MFKRLIVAILLCLIVFLPLGTAFAGDLNFTVAEREAFDEASNGHYIKARQLAEDILKKDPDSIAALYVLAYVFWEGEGNQNRARQYMDKALKRFEAVYCPDGGIPKNGSMQAYHQRMLSDLSKIYAELDQRDKELAVHQKMADLYHNGQLNQSAVWSLIKLDRFDEAESIARKTIASQDSFFVGSAYNDLVAIEDARHEHLKTFHVSEQSVDYSQDKSCVVLLNHARSYVILLNAPKAAEFYVKASKPHDRDCVTDPLTELAGIYLIDGAWQKAISSMTKVRKKHVQKRYVIQTEKAERTMMAEIFYEMGFADRAWTLMKTVIDAPGRLGYDSLPQDQVMMANEVMFYAFSHDALQRAEEKLDAWKGTHFFWFFDSDVRRQIREVAKLRDNIASKQWSTQQKTFKKALDPRNVGSFLVPYYVLAPSYFHSIADILGRKATEEFVDEQIAELKPEEAQIMKPVFDLVRGYIAWRNGDSDKALEYLKEYESKAPRGMSILDYQSKLIQADIAKQRGNTEEMYKLMVDVYQHHPALFRHFDISLPVRFDTETPWSNGDFSDIRSILRKSDRFEEVENAPFVITAQTIEKYRQICLSSQFGTRYACSSVLGKDYGIEQNDEPELADEIDNFYHAAFTPGVDASQADLHSLTGYAIQMTADQALEQLIHTPKNIDIMEAE